MNAADKKAFVLAKCEAFAPHKPPFKYEAYPYRLMKWYDGSGFDLLASQGFARY